MGRPIVAMDLLLVILVVALILYIVLKYAKGPGWGTEASFLAWAISATLLLCGVHLEI